jgi:hypothetical protein
MELALIAGLATIGYFLNMNDSDSGTNTNSKTESYTNLSKNLIPNGPDIYNQNRLTLSEIDQINRGSNNYTRANDPIKTNMIPNYYNQLGSVINREKYHKLLNDRSKTPSQSQEDPNKIYFADNLIVYQPYNDILVDPVLSTDRPIPFDIESDGEGYVPSDEDINRNSMLKDIIQRKVKMATESFDSVDSDTANQYYELQNAQRLLDVSERITDNTSGIRKICSDKNSNGQSEPEYLKMFDDQVFDQYSEPDASNGSNGINDNDLTDKGTLATRERDIAFKNGWSNYNETCDDDMTYNVISKNDFEFHVQNPPLPLFRNKYGYGSNDQGLTDNNNFKRELFTGNLSTYFNKAEPKPFFQPVKDLTYLYGTPVRSEEEESRYIPSLYRQGERLIEPQRITPGLNLDYNDIGQQGYQDMYRALPKTVDETRIASKPKISYAGRIATEGLRGSAGPIQAPVMSYRPDGFKMTTDKDLLPNSAPEVAPRVRENFDAKLTNRATDYTEYVGAPYNSALELGQTIPEWMQAQYAESTRQNFLQQEAGRKYAPYAQTNNNRFSYMNVPTQRAMSGENTYINPAHSDIGSYSNLSDIARTTMKSVNTFSPGNYTSVIGSGQSKPTIHYEDLLPVTMKDLTIDNPLNPNISNVSQTRQRVYTNDIARLTTKEQTLDAILPANVYSHHMMPLNSNQPLRTTLKEQTEIHPTNTMFSAVGQYTMPVNLTQPLRTTIREQTEIHPTNTMFSAIGQYTMPVNLTQPLRTTLKEQTEIHPTNKMFSAIGQYTMPTNLTQPLRTTLKEQTEIHPTNTMFSAIGQYTMPTNLTQPLRTTLKEQTEIHPTNTMLSAIGQYTMPVNLTQPLRTTLKEQTEIHPTNTMLSAIGQYTMPVNLTQPLRTTLKEQTEIHPTNTMISAVGQYTMPVNLTEPLRTTIREQTEIHPTNTMLSAVGQYTMPTNLTEPLRTTIREQTEIHPTNTMLSAVGQYTMPTNLTDPLRTTIREQTSNNTYIGPVDSATKAGILNLYVAPQTTMRDTTVENHYIGSAGMVNGLNGMGYLSNPIEMRTTTKEQTIANDFIGPISANSNGQGLGYLAENPQAKNTIRQTTSEKTYISPVNASNGPSVYDGYYNAPQDNRKECLQVYRSPTDSNVSLGPIIIADGVFVRNDNNLERNPAPSYTYNNQLDRLRTNMTATKHIQVPETLYVDPQILKQLNSNPYAQLPFYQNC